MNYFLNLRVISQKSFEMFVRLLRPHHVEFLLSVLENNGERLETEEDEHSQVGFRIINDNLTFFKGTVHTISSDSQV